MEEEGKSPISVGLHCIRCSCKLILGEFPRRSKFKTIFRADFLAQSHIKPFSDNIFHCESVLHFSSHFNWFSLSHDSIAFLLFILSRIATKCNFLCNNDNLFYFCAIDLHQGFWAWSWAWAWAWAWAWDFLASRILAWAWAPKLVSR